MGNMNVGIIPDVKRTDLVIGLTYAVGAREDIVIDMLKEKLKEFKYHVHVIKISEMIVSKGEKPSDSSYQKISQLMDTGNTMRRESHEEKKVSFEEFVGIGPRKFFDLFSLKLSSGRSIIRQDSRGIVSWKRASARLRCPLVASYTDREKWKVIQLNQLRKKVEEAYNQNL